MEEVKEYISKLITQLKKTTWKHVLRFIPILIFKIVGRFRVYSCIEGREYYRNYVYNYCLQKGLYLKRLMQRKPAEFYGEGGKLEGWTLQDVHQVELLNGRRILGVIRYTEVSTLKFWWIVFMYWGWLDDDSNEDTTDKGYIKTLLPGGEREDHPLAKKYAIEYKDASYRLEKIVFGNTFDLGDTRGSYPFYDYHCTKAWNDRNTAMNFQYLLIDY